MIDENHLSEASEIFGPFLRTSVHVYFFSGNYDVLVPEMTPQFYGRFSPHPLFSVLIPTAGQDTGLQVLASNESRQRTTGDTYVCEAVAGEIWSKCRCEGRGGSKCNPPDLLVIPQIEPSIDVVDAR